MTVADDAPPPRPRPRPRPPARFTHCTCRLSALALVFALLSILQPGRARAQRAVDAQIGTWAVEGADDATLYSAALWRKAWGPLGYSFRALGLIDRGAEDNSLYGLGPELTLLRGQRERAGLSLYGAAGVSLALESSESDVAALWSAGVGLELRAPSLFSASLEARRLVEDTGFHGFWNLAQGDRQGWLLTLGLSFRWGGGSGSAGRAPAPAPVGPTSYPAAGGAEPSAATPAADLPVATGDVLGEIVRTALAVMGEPYRWGGTSTDEGFDCSGLIWFAYTSHGVSLPRVSRDQAQAGRAISKRIEALELGDILTFSNRPGVITHVGLYIGEGRFIHATTSGGVRIGALDTPRDGNDRWYLTRWVGARRVLE